jgi:hypothetical protein
VRLTVTHGTVVWTDAKGLVMKCAAVLSAVAVVSGGVGMFVGVLITSRHVLDREAAENRRKIAVDMARCPPIPR